MTNSNAAPARAPVPQQGDETQLFAELNGKLFHSVRRVVHASDALIEDACSIAWIQLLRCQPDRDTVFGWLRTTAVREAWRLSRREHHAPMAAADACAAEAIPGTSLALQIEAREALRAVTKLRPEHRRTYERHVAGLTYEQIATETGHSRRQVERHLLAARPVLDAHRSEILTTAS